MSLAVGNHSAFEQAVKDRQKQLAAQYGRKDRIITNQEIEALAEEFFGKLEAPAGAEILKQTPIELIYRTADGKEYRQFRNLNPNLGGSIGKVDTTLLNGGPAIGSQSAAGEGDLAAQLTKQLQELYASQGFTPRSLDEINALAAELQKPISFGVLDPQTEQYLNAIDASARQAQAQKSNDLQQQLIAQLFGSGVNRSTVAGNAAARFAQEQGLVDAELSSQDAQRRLAVNQFLTQSTQQNRALALNALLEGSGLEQNAVNQGQNLMMQLLNQALQRELAAKQFDLSEREFAFSQDQALANNALARDQFEWQAQQARKAQRAALVKSILGGAASFLPMIGGLGGLGSLFGGAGNGGAPPIGGDGGYG